MRSHNTKKVLANTKRALGLCVVTLFIWSFCGQAFAQRTKVADESIINDAEASTLARSFTMRLLETHDFAPLIEETQLGAQGDKETANFAFGALQLNDDERMGIHVGILNWMYFMTLSVTGEPDAKHAKCKSLYPASLAKEINETEQYLGAFDEAMTAEQMRKLLRNTESFNAKFRAYLKQHPIKSTSCFKREFDFFEQRDGYQVFAENSDDEKEARVKTPIVGLSLLIVKRNGVLKVREIDALDDDH